MKLAIIFMCIFINGLSGKWLPNQPLLYEGDICTFNNTHQGVCKAFYKCPIVQRQLDKKRILPVNCGYNGFIPIVCCPRAKKMLPKGRKSKGRKTKRRRITGKLAKQYCGDPIKYEMISAAGGKDATEENFHSMAAIGWELKDKTGYVWNCGGTLITEYYVLTAAHCTLTMNKKLRTINPTIVKLGTINLKDPYAKNVEIDEIFVHPRYNVRLKYNDIALLKIAEDVTQSSLATTACLMPTNKNTEFIANKNKYISFSAFGWGETQTAQSSDILQKVKVNLIDNKACGYKYKSKKFLPNGIINSQICAGNNGKQDTCRGDSGGPLLIYGDQDNYILVGVTSFGVGCLGTDTPGVYTRVAPYINWIESIVWP